MTAPARTAAFHTLRAILGDRSDLPAALAASRQRLTDERDRALAADIAIGTLRWLRSLDFLIEHFAKRPVARIDADVLAILRLSLYQLLHLDRVPASAVVDDAVDLTRGARKTSATGFVNAVLRTTLRERHRLPLPPRPGDDRGRDASLAYLGITHSHPEWLVARWLDRYGFDAVEAWLRFNNEPPSLMIRANRIRSGRDQLAASLAGDGIDTTPARYAPDGLTVVSGNPLRQPLDGSFFVQDEASQLVALMVGARPGERILDLCAAPGGKTTMLATAMEDRGSLIATDVRPRRLSLLRDTVRLSGATCIEVMDVPPTGVLPFEDPFDRVLVDAPCSGLGTLRRDPDIRWRRQPADLARLAADEAAILTRAAPVVATGGRLIYATCSSEPEENEQVVDRFLAEHPAFSLVNLRDDVATDLHPLIDERGMMRTLPHAHGLEAFFAAAVVRSKHA